MAEKLPQSGIGYKEYLYYNSDDELEGVIALFTYKDPAINQAAIGLMRNAANSLTTLYEDPNRPINTTSGRRKEESGFEDTED